MEQEQIWDKIADQWNNFRQQKFKPVYDFIQRYKLKKGKILEIGCGNARNLIPFANLNFECHGIDFSKKMLENAKKNAKRSHIKLNLIKADITKLPYKNNYFNYVLHIASLHHLNSEEKIIKSLDETYRILKPKGLVLLTVWNKLQLKFLLKPRDLLIPWKIKDKKYERYYHLFDYYELKKLVKKTPFKILESSILGKNLVFVLEKD